MPAYVAEEFSIAVYDAVASEAIASVAYVVAYAAVSFGIFKAAQYLGPKPPSGIGHSLEMSTSDPMSPARVVLGKIRSGGVYTIPFFSDGNNGEFLHQIITLAGHQIDSFVNVWAGQDMIANSGITAVTGTANDGLVTGSSTTEQDGSTSAKWSDKHWIRRYTGTPTQALDYILGHSFFSPTIFTSDFRGRGLAYAAIKMKYDQQGSNRGQPVQWTFEMQGARVYDPRLDSTQPGGSGSQRYTDPTTWTFSNNSALCAAWYIIEQNIGGGFDPASEIDWTTVAAAATVCDTTMSGSYATPDGSQPRYTCGCVLDATNDFVANLKVIVDSMLGHFVYVDGVWKLYAGAWTSPSNNLTQADFVGPVTIQCITPRTTQGTSGTQRYNGVRGSFIDASKNWQLKECFPRASDTYKTADGGERIWNEMQFPAITNEYQCQRVCEFMLRQSRNQIVVQGRLGPKWLQLAVYDTIGLTWPDMGWSNKTFRIVGYTDDPTGGVQVVLREEQSGDWNDLLTAEYGVPSVATIPTVNPTTPSAPASLTTTGFPGAIDVQWPDSVIKPSGTYYRLDLSPLVNTYTLAGSCWQGTGTRAVIPIGNTQDNYFWINAYNQNGVYGGSFPDVSTYGIKGDALLTDWQNLADNAVTFVTMANCSVSQVFSGTGAIHASEVGRIDFTPAQVGSHDATVIATITCRAQMGSITTKNALQARFVTGVSSVYTGPDMSALSTAMSAMTIQGQFPYTKGNSAYLQLNWDVASGTNGITVDQVSIQAEFVKR